MGAGEGERGEGHGDLAQALAILKGGPEDQGSRPEEAAQTLVRKPQPGDRASAHIPGATDRPVLT